MKVKNNQELAHLWASQNVESADGSNFSFSGTKLYSYTTLVGIIIKDNNGFKIALLSEYRYSNTTAKHLSFAANAMRNNMEVFYTKTLDPQFINSSPLPQIIAGANELIKGYLELLPEKFRTNTQKAEAIYQQINHQIELIERLGGKPLAPIDESNAIQWRAEYMGQIIIKFVERNIVDQLATVKGFNKIVDSGDFARYLKNNIDCVSDLQDLKNKAESIGVKVPTGTATAIKKALVNISISKEREYANKLTEVIKDYREFINKFIGIHLSDDTKKPKSLIEKLTNYESKLQSILSNPPEFVCKPQLVTPLAKPRDYLNLAVLEELRGIEKDLELQLKLEVEAWRKGLLPIDSLEGYDNIYLRVYGKTIETSHSAIVPLSVAEKLWRFVKIAIKKGEDLLGDFGESARVGHYTLNEVRKDGSIKVGCHIIGFSELELIAKQLGFKGAHYMEFVKAQSPNN